MSSFSKASGSSHEASSSSTSSFESSSKTSGRSSEASKEASKSAQAQRKVRSQSCDAIVVQVKQKLRKHPKFKDWEESALEEKAIELTDHKKLKALYFTHLLHPDYEVSEDLYSYNEEEAAKAVERDRIRIADAKVLPVKLYLRYIKMYAKNPKLYHNLASLMGADHGPMHAALKVGDVLLEWNTSCLVIPRSQHECKFIFEADIAHSESLKNVRSNSFEGSSVSRDKAEVIDSLHEISAVKSELIDALVAVIVDYNSRRYYHVVSRNCQTFVDTAMKALDIKDGPKLEGKLLQLYENLKAGKSKGVPDAFPEHIDLDGYVTTQIEKDRQLADMPYADLQYLACVYHQFHLIQRAKSSPLSDKEHVTCVKSTCQLSTLVSVIDAHRQNALTKQHAVARCMKLL